MRCMPWQPGEALACGACGACGAGLAIGTGPPQMTMVWGAPEVLGQHEGSTGHFLVQPIAASTAQTLNGLSQRPLNQWVALVALLALVAVHCDIAWAPWVRCC